MLISCKCLNFIGASNNQQKQLQTNSQSQNVLMQSERKQQFEQEQAASAAAVATADSKKNIGASVAAVAMQQSASDCNSSSAATSFRHNNNIMSDSSKFNDGDTYSLTNALRQAFLKKYQRNFVFYSQCVDFFKQAIGPLSDLTINNVSQKDLIYSLTLEVPDAQTPTISSWQISICSNCNLALCAKRLYISTPQIFINCGLLTNNEELSKKRSDKSFSDTFGILIMDHPNLEVPTNNQIHNISSNLGVNSLSTSYATSVAINHLDSKQLRLRQLQSNLQQRLQREIAETDERIQRYTTQQFALLKSFREKSEQEYQMLVALIQCIPEEQSNELLDRQPPILDVSNNGGNLTYGTSKRRNTISSRRELNTMSPSTPTLTQPPNNIFNLNRDIQVKNSYSTATTSSPTSAIVTTTSNIRSSPPSSSETAAIITSTVASGSSVLNRKMSNFDTPPATPEALPMSVGNSPTFRQQQQTLSFFSQQKTFQQQFPTPTVETADDCLFELEGVESSATVINSQSNRTMYLQNPPSPLRILQTQQTQNMPHHILPNSNKGCYRNLNCNSTQSENHISDIDESDGAEEAEDALDLDTSMPIATPQRRLNSKSAQSLNFAKSLPIEISNSPLAAERNYITTLESDEDPLDNNLDIAASIKALAKSVHGEAVFGDLPRPRLRSQI